MRPIVVHDCTCQHGSSWHSEFSAYLFLTLPLHRHHRPKTMGDRTMMHPSYPNLLARSPDFKVCRILSSYPNVASQELQNAIFMNVDPCLFNICASCLFTVLLTILGGLSPHSQRTASGTILHPKPAYTFCHSYASGDAAQIGKQAVWIAEIL